MSYSGRVVGNGHLAPPTGDVRVAGDSGVCDQAQLTVNEVCQFVQLLRQLSRCFRRDLNSVSVVLVTSTYVYGFLLDPHLNATAFKLEYVAFLQFSDSNRSSIAATRIRICLLTVDLNRVYSNAAMT
jgi:hypothetical protein